jgi:hypothetical protein
MAVVVVKTGCRVGDCSMCGWRTVFWNEAAANRVAAMLRQSGKREHHDCQCQNYSRKSEERFHGHLQE